MEFSAVGRSSLDATAPSVFVRGSGGGRHATESVSELAHTLPNLALAAVAQDDVHLGKGALLVEKELVFGGRPRSRSLCERHGKVAWARRLHVAGTRWWRDW